MEAEDRQQQDMRELKELMTQLRIEVAKIQTNQNAVTTTLADFRTERLHTYDKLTKKVTDIEEDVTKLDRKINWATGAVAVITGFVSLATNAAMKKVGLG